MVSLHCDIYHKDEKVGRLDLEGFNLIKNEVYTDNILKHPFPKSTKAVHILSIIEDRVICNERCDKEILNSMGFSVYNVYDVFKANHGIDIDDFIWFKFDGESDDICWDVVKARG